MQARIGLGLMHLFGSTTWRVRHAGRRPVGQCRSAGALGQRRERQGQLESKPAASCGSRRRLPDCRRVSMASISTRSATAARRMPAPAKGHFNPAGKAHGHHAGSERHGGDMPNLVANAAGEARFSGVISGLTLSGPNGVVGAQRGDPCRSR